MSSLCSLKGFPIVKTTMKENARLSRVFLSARKHSFRGWGVGRYTRRNFGMRELEVLCVEKTFDDIFSRFDRVHKRDRQKDRITLARIALCRRLVQQKTVTWQLCYFSQFIFLAAAVSWKSMHHNWYWVHCWYFYLKWTVGGRSVNECR